MVFEYRAALDVAILVINAIGAGIQEVRSHVR
jgi:hypothetical protein